MTALKKCLCLVLAVLTLAPFSVLAAETGTPALTQTATSPADETLPAETASGEPIKFSDVDYDSTLGKTIEKLVDKGVISGFPDRDVQIKSDADARRVFKDNRHLRERGHGGELRLRLPRC